MNRQNNIGTNLSFRRLAGLTLFMVAMCLAASCKEKKTTNAALLAGIAEGMSEKDVVSLLGAPERISAGRYLKDDPDPSRVLYYTLSDGRRWVIVINSHDELIGSGESAGGRKGR